MKKLAIVFALSALIGCTSDDGQSDANQNASDCRSAKCDDGSIGELTSMPGQFGSCTVTPDLEAADIFFSVDTWTCQFVGFEDGAPLQLRRISAYTVDGDNRHGSSVTFSPEELAAAAQKPAGAWSGDEYPVETHLSVVMDFVRSDGGRLQSPSVDTEPVVSEWVRTVAERPDGDLEQAYESEIEFWPVVLWPTTEFAESWSNDEIGFFSVNIVGEIVFSETSTRSFRHGRVGVNGADLKALPKKTFVVPAQPDHGLPTLELRLDSNDLTNSLEVDGPGYYLLGLDGSIKKATPEEVRERGMSRTSGEPATDADAGADASGTDLGTVAPDMGQVDAGPVVDPCGDSCVEGEVCVNAECVDRSQQYQPNYCPTPEAICDGEDSDCAPDHACVDGLCRRLTCQTQPNYCPAPEAPCDGENSDCADGHACVEGLCRRLSCQTQPNYCPAPEAPCDDEDSDCADGNVCVQGLCRLLTCQTQPNYCPAPEAPCDEGEQTDCAEGHVCESGKCQRLSCL